MSEESRILNKLREVYPAGLTPFDASAQIGVPFRLGLQEIMQLKLQGLVISRQLGGVERIFLATPPPAAELAASSLAPEPAASAPGAPPLPDIGSLADAVRAVIENNTRSGHPPTRLGAATRGLSGLALVREIERMILDGAPMAPLEPAVSQVPTLLTIEDFVVRYGTLWGFGPTAIETCRVRAELFDQLTGGPRFD